MYRNMNYWKSYGNIRIFAVLFLVAVVLAISPIIHFSTMETVYEHTVTEKERIVGKESSKYLIFTDKEVFENTDSLLAFKYNSSDFYGRIQVGQVCSFKVTGFRIPFLSSYRNILSYNCYFPENQ